MASDLVAVPGQPEEPGEVNSDGCRIIGGGVLGEWLGDEHVRDVDQRVDTTEPF